MIQFRSRALAALFATTALAACASPAERAQLAEQKAIVDQAVVGPTAALNAPKPTIGAWGFDEAGMDRAVAPGQSFYDFANGNWARTTAIPADKANYGMFTMLEDLSNARTRGILDQQAKDPTSKIGIAYTTFQDTAAIDAKGLTPIRPWLDEVKALRVKSGYAALVAKGDRAGVAAPFRTAWVRTTSVPTSM